MLGFQFGETHNFAPCGAVGQSATALAGRPRSFFFVSTTAAFGFLREKFVIGSPRTAP